MFVRIKTRDETPSRHARLSRVRSTRTTLEKGARAKLLSKVLDSCTPRAARQAGATRVDLHTQSPVAFFLRLVRHNREVTQNKLTALSDGMFDGLGKLNSL